ncbi:hypothetical protein BDR26DRAFT_873002 [Obelidium mucronatum]|nr:hypothetical protein BDR26DRAFT_873002 [Obelidium mucronatum]
MESNIELYIRYQSNAAVPIESHWIGETRRQRPLRTVGHLIAVFVDLPKREVLGLPGNHGPVTLHSVIDGVESAAMESDVILSTINTGRTARTALLIKSPTVSVVECPLYPLSFVSTSEASTDSPYAVEPESVARWYEFEALVGAYNGTAQTQMYTPPDNTIIGTEASMYPHFAAMFLWAKDALILSGESILQDYTLVDVKGQPDFIFVKGRVVFLTFEGKRPVIISTHEHLAEAFSEQLHTDRNGGLVRAVCQEFGYMVHNGNQFGVLSTWEGNWFFKRGADPSTSNTCYISNCVRWDATDVTFFKALACVAAMARESTRIVPTGVRQSSWSSLASSSSLSRNFIPSAQSGTVSGSSVTPAAPQRFESGNSCSSFEDTTDNLKTCLSESTLTDVADDQSIFNQEPFKHRLPLCDILGQTLGYGRCGAAYECEINGVLSAVKLIDPHNYRTGKSSRVAVFRESEAYQNLRELQSFAIPRLVLRASGYLGFILLATELGSEGVFHGKMGEEQKALALKSLRMIHARGYIHGDIRKENVVFHVEDGSRKALWIDLESCRLGVPQEFEAEIRSVLAF